MIHRNTAVRLYKRSAKYVAGFFVGALVLLTLYEVQAWTGPSTTAPGGNVAAVIDTSSTAQSKAGGLLLNSGGATNGLIVQSGNVGIGTTTPGDKLEVAGGSGRGITISGTNPGLLLGTNTQLYDVSGNGFAVYTNGRATLGLYQNNSGNVGIGTPTPNSVIPLTLRNQASSGMWYVGPDSSNNFVIYNQGNTGMYMLNGGTSWNASSDQRLKTNIATLSDSTLDKVLALNPVTFNWKSTTAATTTQIGFIAQQVQKVFPDLVSVGPDTVVTNADGSKATVTSPLGVNYTGLVVPTIKAVQELNQKVEAQQKQIDDLIAQVKALQNK